MLWISSEQPAAEAKKADGASWTVLLIPTPPALTGSDACNQAGSDAMETLTILLKILRSILSNISSSEDRKHGAVRRTYNIFGMAKE